MRYAALYLLAACGGTEGKALRPQAARAPLSLAADDHMILIPDGKYIAGSTPEERATAYDDLQIATTTDTAREQGWFEKEADRHQTTLPAYRIDLMPVTQAQYAEFVSAGKAPPPALPDPGEVARFSWTSTTPPQDRLDHPVVLVTWDEASRYCAWRGELRGQARRLPSAGEYEKAARGTTGLAYPWGNTFEPSKLNSADGGPKDTVPAGQFAGGASEFGLLDIAGNVRQWTSTSAGQGAYLVKGSGWDDHGGIGRAAWVHATAAGERAANVGFRCAGSP